MNVTAISPLVALPAAVVSGLLLALAIVRLGRGKFPAALFGAAFSIGVVMGTLVLVAESPFDLKDNRLQFSTAFVAFAFAGFPEEAAKLAGAYFFVRRHWLRPDGRAIMLGAAAAALGFALFEDVLYIAAAGSQWGAVAAARATTVIPMHVLLGLYGGYAIARAEHSPTRFAAGLRIAGAWVIASLLHGVYDFGLLTAAKPPYPAYVEAAARWLRLDSTVALHGLVLLAAFGVAAVAFGAVGAIGRPPFANGPEPPAIRPNWLLRVGLARAAGWALGGLLLAVATLLLAVAGLASFVAGLADPLLFLGLPSVFLSAIALLLMRRTRPRAPGRARPALRRLGWAAAAGLVVLCGFAAYRWGEKPARTIVAVRLTVGGAQLAAKGDFEAAKRQYDRALTIDPDFLDALANRGRVYDLLHRYDLALADFDRAVALQPTNPLLLAGRADLQNERHRSAEAIEDLGRALALAPDNPQFLVERAGVYADSGDAARAAADLATAAALAPNDPDVLIGQARAAVQAGDFDRARQDLDAAIQLNPAAVNGLFLRGRLSLYRGDEARAVADFQRAAAGSAQPYPAMWLFAAQARGGLDGSARLEAKTKSWPSGVWPYPIIQQMLGKSSAAEARAAAVDDDERCEADFYNGELLLAHRSPMLAWEAMRKALAECPRGFIEREGAEEELKRLAGGAAAAPAVAATDSGAQASAGDAAREAPPSAGAAAVSSVRASASSRALISGDAAGPGAAFWSFIDRGAAGGEMNVVLYSYGAPIHGKLSLRRWNPEDNVPRYELQFVVPSSDPTSTLAAALGGSADEVTVKSSSGAFVSPDAWTGRLARVSDTTYGLTFESGDAQQLLARIAQDADLSVELAAASGKKVRLDFKLDAQTALVARAAADAWR
jgi:tetratricopeptide (TPR) repeat protein